MKTAPILSDDQKRFLNPSLNSIIAYRKSGLSLNHIIGCSLDCAYCVRHFFDNYEMKEPHLLCSDEEAVRQLVNHAFFIPDVTPIQIFNRATDPFLPTVKKHTHEVLEQLDDLGLQNLILLITRASVTREDMALLEGLKNIKVTLLLTYSGIINEKIEPICKSNTTVKSIEIIGKYKKRTKLITYWRPLVEGWNDDIDSFNRVLKNSIHADAIVYTGYYHRPENDHHLRKMGVSIPPLGFSRRKVLSNELERKILSAYKKSNINVPLFRKTSCGVTFAHNLPDYNGHWGVNEICDICPANQKELCQSKYSVPEKKEFENLLSKYGYATPFLIEDGHVWTSGLGEEKRYHLQHSLAHQIWDIDTPHFANRHGRATLDQEYNNNDKSWYENVKTQFYHYVITNDD